MSEKPTYEELEQRVRELESVESQYKRIFEEQQQKEKRYQNLFENMLHEIHVWQLVYDDYGNIITWKLVDANPAALKSWDKNLSEIVGRTADEIFPNSNTTELFMPIVKKLFTEGAPHIWESYFPDTDQFLHMISVPFGEYFISTGFDLTDRKKAEEELKARQEQLELVLQGSRDGFWDWNIETGDLYMSPRWHEQLGYDIGEVASNIETLQSVCHPEDYPHVIEVIQKHIDGNLDKFYEVEHRFKTKGGDWKWVLARGKTIRDEKGNAIRMIGTSTDITGRKKAEEMLLKERRFLDRLMKTSPVSLTVVNREGQITMANAMAEKTLGLKRLDIYNRTYNDPAWHITDYHGNNFPEEKLPFLIVKRTESAVYNIEHAIEYPDGRRIFLSINAAPLFDSDGDFDGMVSALDNVTERKAAEEKLLRSEAHLEEAQRIAHAGSWDWIAATDTPTWSGELCRILEVDPDKPVPSMADQDRLYTPDSIVRMRTSAEKATQTGEPYEIELERVRDDGSRRWLLARGERWYDEQGEIIGLRGTALDITDRKQAEEALKESERKYRNIAESMPGLILKYKLNPDGSDQLLYINKGVEDLYEIQREDAVKNNTLLWDRVHRDDLEEFKASIKRSAENLSFWRLEHRLKMPDGRVKWVSSRGIPNKQEDGSVVWDSLAVNITEQKRAEDALRESEEKYRSMMESMKDSVYICSSELVIEYMNPRMVSRIGRDATGDYCYKAIYNSDEKCSWCVFDNILQGEHIDYELADPGDNRYYSVTNSPIYHSDETISKLTIFRDITDNKSIEAQLHQARKMETIGTMAGGIAHDFNNILFVITGNAELAMEDIPAWNPVHENLKEIKSAGLRAAGIVKQILTFSRQTAQELKPIGAVMVIKDALKFMRSTIPATIEIQQDFPDKEVTILGDPIQINQVMMNLCINASQAMEETGGVLYILVETITLDEKANDSYPDLTTGDWLKITVNDTGPGIRSDIIDRVFDPYFTTKDVGKGSGMGLAIVHGIVKNHHGTISVESELGKGTTFTIFFPVATERPAKDVKASDVIPRGAGERVLFVDDEASITNMTGKMLERLGYKVQTATSPVDALERFRAKPDAFDLVLTDMTMPQMTGVGLSEKLKKFRPDIPVVICTGYSSLIDEEKSKFIGIEGYVMKPIVMKDIAIAIRKVLDEAKGSAQGSVSNS